MTKKIISIIILFLLTACSKTMDIPKLQSKEINITYGEKMIDINYENLLDLSSFNEEEIKELETNGEIEYQFKYDNSNNIQSGIYEIKISYYSDVVRTIIHVIDTFDLTAKQMEIPYGQELTEMDYSQLLDLSLFSNDQINELNTNGTMEYTFDYDRKGNIKPGDYEVKISYYDQTVISTLRVVAENDSPIFDQEEAITVPLGQRDYDFTALQCAYSPIGETLTYIYDTGAINFDVVDRYPLYVAAYDENNNISYGVIPVDIVE